MSEVPLGGGQPSPAAGQADSRIEAGGKCALCGYDRHIGALQFHHRNSSQKLFALAERGVTRSLEAARAEARKCVLLCSNCHAEVEAAMVKLP